MSRCRSTLVVPLLLVAISVLGGPRAGAENLISAPLSISIAPVFSGPDYSAPGEGVVSGDFNNDGFCDIAVLDCPESDPAFQRVTILLGGTDREFSQRRVTALGTSFPSLIKAADLNSDGSPDLVVSSVGGREIVPLLNRADATFVAGPALSIPADLNTLVVGDINRDGQPDIVASGISDSIYILLGNGDGSFQQYQATVVPLALRYPTAMAMGDVNQDGNVDLVLATIEFDAAGILFGNGAGMFATSSILSAGGNGLPGPVAIVDMNIDGRPDIVLSNAGDVWYPQNTLTIFYSTSAGVFAESAPVQVGLGPFSLATSDVSGDGNADLLVGCLGEYYVTPATGITVVVSSVSGAQVRGVEIPVGSAVIAVTAGDFDGDLHSDVAVLNVYTTLQPTLSVAFGVVGGSFMTRTDIPTAPGPARIIARDFNGDGNVDLAVAGYSSVGVGAVSVFLGSPDGRYQLSAQYAVGLYPSSLAASDINRDSYLDLIVARGNAGTLSLLLGNGNGTFRSGGDLAGGNSVTDLALMDFNADNSTDVMFVDINSSNAICVMLGNGDGTFRAKQCYGATSYPNRVTLGDLNIDGYMDAVVGNSTSGAAKITVMLGNGDGSFRAGTEVTVNYSSYLVNLADLNRDGRLDLITTLGYQLAWFPGNGDGTFGTRRDIAFLPSPVALAVADIDGDGNPDLATANSLTSAVSILLGDGNGTFRSPANYSVGASPTDLVAVDYSLDGRPDLIVVNHLGASMSQLLNLGVARPQDRPPSVVAPDSIRGAEGALVEAHAAASDPDGDAIGSLVAIGLPSGATFTTDATNTAGLLSWMPGFMQSGVYGVTISATSGSPAQLGSASTVITIANTDQAPVVTAPSTKAGSEGALLSFGVAASDPDGDAITALTATGSAIAAGGTFNPGAGDSSGTFTWTPSFTASAHSPYSVTFVASNLLSGSAATSITVEPCALAIGFDFTPNTLNLRSMGHWVTAYLEPLSPFTPADIDTRSLRLNGTVMVDPAAPVEIGDHDADGIPDVMVKFNRANVELAVSEGDSVPVTLMGTVGGQCFRGTDYIRVLRADVKAPAAGSTLYPGMTTAVRWAIPSGVHIQSVAILSSVDNGISWNLDAQGLPNTGSADWIAPSFTTETAKVAVVLVESTDATGYVVDGVLGTSGAFVIGGAAGVDAGAIPEFALRAVIPNPAQEALSVTFSLPDAKPATIEVFNVSGRRVAAREVGSFGPGFRTITVGERMTLPSGVYLVRLSQAGRSLTTRAVLVR